MGRTVPSFRIALAMEKEEWKPFRNALNKSERKDFDEMWDIARLYISACSNSVQLVPLQPIVISILFHHYRELLGCIREIEHMQSKASMNKQGFGEEMKKERRKTRRHYRDHRHNSES
jgi:hypothetical protein